MGACKYFLLIGEPADGGRAPRQLGDGDDGAPGGGLEPGLLRVRRPRAAAVRGVPRGPAVSVPGIAPPLWSQHSRIDKRPGLF